MSPLTINVKKGQYQTAQRFEVAVFKHLSFSDIEPIQFRSRRCKFLTIQNIVS